MGFANELVKPECVFPAMWKTDTGLGFLMSWIAVNLCPFIYHLLVTSKGLLSAFELIERLKLLKSINLDLDAGDLQGLELPLIYRSENLFFMFLCNFIFIIMETGNDIKASLNIAMQTQDPLAFEEILNNSAVHYSLFVDGGGFNIFHDLANCLTKEVFLLEFLKILIFHFQSRYKEDSNSIIKEMLNSQTTRQRQTPLLQAVQHNRRVLFI